VVLVGRLDLTAAFDLGGRPEQRAAAVAIVKVLAREIGVDDPSARGFVTALGSHRFCQAAGVSRGGDS